MKSFAIFLLVLGGEVLAAGEPQGTTETLDTDNDGYVSIYEWSVAGDEQQFAARDSNGDQRLDRAELRNPPVTAHRQEDNTKSADRRVQMMSENLSPHVDFTEYDTDGNGMLDRGEASDNAYLTSHFDTWDEDSNDLLDIDEVEQGHVDVDSQ